MSNFVVQTTRIDFLFHISMGLTRRSCVMLDSLITSKTRIKLLLKFFLNPSMKAYLRGLADEFGESTNAIRLELNHLEEAGLLCSETERNKKVFQANPGHPLFEDIHRLVMKHTGITQIIEEVVKRIRDIHKVWICGDFATGKDSGKIELVVSGNDIDEEYFYFLVRKAEALIKREIRYFFIPLEKEAEYLALGEKILLVWKK